MSLDTGICFEDQLIITQCKIQNQLSYSRYFNNMKPVIRQWYQSRLVVVKESFSHLSISCSKRSIITEFWIRYCVMFEWSTESTVHSWIKWVSFTFKNPIWFNSMILDNLVVLIDHYQLMNHSSRYSQWIDDWSIFFMF